MKKIFNIFIIIFVLCSLYIVKDDFGLAYQKTKKYITNNEVLKNDIKQTDVIIEHSEMPGALRVINSVFSTTPDSASLSKEGVIIWTNKMRLEQGLPPLKENNELNIAAKNKLEDMFDNQYFEHISPKGLGVGDLAKESGYFYILVGENLAFGNFKNDEAVVEAWMNSEGHRANILNTNYSEIGVAVGRGDFEGERVWIAVQHFGKPKSSCPIINQSLKKMIDNDQIILNEMQKDLTKKNNIIENGNMLDNVLKSEKINEYNKLVVEYNELLSQLKKNINDYNNQVKVFNECVEQSTS